MYCWRTRLQESEGCLYACAGWSQGSGGGWRRRAAGGPWPACPCRPWSGARTSCWTAGTATPRSARPASGCAARKLLTPLIPCMAGWEACGRGLQDGHPAHVSSPALVLWASSALSSPLVHSSSKGKRLLRFLQTAHDKRAESCAGLQAGEGCPARRGRPGCSAGVGTGGSARAGRRAPVEGLSLHTCGCAPRRLHARCGSCSL